MSKYKQVYNEIKSQINNGNLAPLQELPSENELMQSYGFSKDTIRKALSLLEIDGYIQKQQGRNSIVLKHDLSKPQMLSEIKTVSELNSASTHQVKTTLTSLYIVQGEEELMHIFNVDDQIDFYRIARLREIDGEAVEYEVSYFDRRIVPFISREIAEHSIYHYLENELKLKISHSQRKIVFRYANEEEKKAIDLGEYVPLIWRMVDHFNMGVLAIDQIKLHLHRQQNDMSSFFVNDRSLFKKFIKKVRSFLTALFVYTTLTKIVLLRAFLASSVLTHQSSN